MFQLIFENTIFKHINLLFKNIKNVFKIACFRKTVNNHFIVGFLKHSIYFKVLKYFLNLTFLYFKVLKLDFMVLQ